MACGPHSLLAARRRRCYAVQKAGISECEGHEHRHEDAESRQADDVAQHAYYERAEGHEDKYAEGVLELRRQSEQGQRSRKRSEDLILHIACPTG